MRRGAATGRAAAVAFAFLALLTPAAIAQSGASASSPVIVENAGDAEARVRVGEEATFSFTLFNLNSNLAYFVTVTASGLDGWELRATPNKFFAEPRATMPVSVTLVATEERPPDLAEGAVRFHIVNPDTGAVTLVEEPARVVVTDAALVLDVFENPLPPPLDNGYGVFLLDIAFWAVFGVASFLTGDTVVRILTRHTPVQVTRVLIGKLRWPVFYFVLLLGVKQSVDVLPANPATVFVSRFAAAVAVGVVGVYVGYRVVDALLYYYSAEIAPRTATRVDDVLVPFGRKIALLVLVLVGVGYTLAAFGLNPGVVFAGAGIMGLVIAFAAQDTLSNFFSGIFILLDRPFLEGDEVQLETGEICVVQQVGLRSTRLYHGRNHETIILPNNQLSSRRITNLTQPDPRYRVLLEFGVAYGTDVARVREVAERVIRAHPGVIKDEPAPVLFAKFGESSLDFAVRPLVNEYRDRWKIASDLREELYRALAKEGIEIPFPQRVLHIKGAPTPELPSQP